MSSFLDEDITGKVASNVFYDSFKETVTFYKQYLNGVWEDGGVICLADTPDTVGFLPKSDIIITYDKNNCKPLIVTERIFQHNYTKKEFRKVFKSLLFYVKTFKYCLGFRISVTRGNGYIDYNFYKQDWLEFHMKGG